MSGRRKCVKNYLNKYIIFIYSKRRKCHKFVLFQYFQFVWMFNSNLRILIAFLLRKWRNNYIYAFTSLRISNSLMECFWIEEREEWNRMIRWSLKIEYILKSNGNWLYRNIIRKSMFEIQIGFEYDNYRNVSFRYYLKFKQTVRIRNIHA